MSTTIKRGETINFARATSGPTLLENSLLRWGNSHLTVYGFWPHVKKLDSVSPVMVLAVSGHQVCWKRRLSEVEQSFIKQVIFSKSWWACFNTDWEFTIYGRISNYPGRQPESSVQSFAGKIVDIGISKALLSLSYVLTITIALVISWIRQISICWQMGGGIAAKSKTPSTSRQ